MSTKFSYSKLDTFKTCHFRYYLQYVLGNYVYTGSIATEFGSLIHETEESIANTLKENKSINYIELKNNFILKLADIEYKYKKEYWEVDSKSSRNYQDKAYEYLTGPIYNLERFMAEHPTYEIAAIEQKFNFTYTDDYIFTGAIDRVFKDKITNAYLIQDIKSWAVAARQEDLAVPLQFVIYTLAAENLFKCSKSNIKCEYYLPLVDSGLVQCAGALDFIERGINKLNDLFAQIENKNYTPSPSPLCHWCPYCPTNPVSVTPYKYLCPYFSWWTRESPEFLKENNWQGLDHHQEILENYHKKYKIT